MMQSVTEHIDVTKQCKNTCWFGIKQNTTYNENKGDDLHLYFIISVPFKSGIKQKKSKTQRQIHTLIHKQCMQCA